MNSAKSTLTAATCQHRRWPCEFVDEVELVLPEK